MPVALTHWATLSQSEWALYSKGAWLSDNESGLMGNGKENTRRFNLHSNAKIFILYLFYPTLWLQTFLEKKKKKVIEFVWNNSLPRKVLCRPPVLENDFMLIVNSLSHVLKSCMHNIFTFQILLIFQVLKVPGNRGFEIFPILIDFSPVLKASWLIAENSR